MFEKLEHIPQEINLKDTASTRNRILQKEESSLLSGGIHCKVFLKSASKPISNTYNPHQLKLNRITKTFWLQVLQNPIWLHGTT